MKPTPDTLVQQFLDGALNPIEEAEALRKIAEDPDARSLLRVDGHLQHMLAEEFGRPQAIPPAFTDRVMQGVARVEAAERRTALQTRLQCLWNALLRPRPLTWRPAYAISLIATLLIAVGIWANIPVPTTTETPQTSVATAQEEQSVLVRFVFVDEDASTVAVAGDFNYWEPVELTKHEADGRVVWSGLMAVPPGEHRYMFVLDGEEWVTDPFAPQARDDGFGAPNAILSL